MPKERIGIMGGSFNPIHGRHIEMAVCAKREFDLERIIFLPTGNPPHKRSGLEDAQDRYEMTWLAVMGMEDVSVSRMEIDRDGVIYTVDTLTKLQKQMPPQAHSTASTPSWFAAVPAVPPRIAKRSSTL